MGADLKMTRRSLLGSAAAGTVAMPFADAVAAPARARIAPTTIDVILDVNGKPRPLKLDPRTSLLDALREHLDLTGSKKGCDHGQCGACTVLIDGRRSLACLLLAVALNGRAVTTIEGIGGDGPLHPV